MLLWSGVGCIQCLLYLQVPEDSHSLAVLGLVPSLVLGLSLEFLLNQNPFYYAGALKSYDWTLIFWSAYVSGL